MHLRHAAVVTAIVSVSLLSMTAQSAGAATASIPTISKLSTTAGPMTGGTRVTITGKNFSHVKAVKFGSTRGTSLRVLSHKKLTVAAPRHAAGLVDIRIVTRGGTSRVVKSDRFTYIPSPSISTITTAAGPNTGGTRLTITGKNFIRVSRVEFGSTPGKALTVASPNKLSVTAPSHPSGTVHIRVVTAYGMSTAIAADRFTFGTPMKTTLLDVNGSGAYDSANFTAPTTPDQWAITYTYDCANFGTQGNFAITVHSASGGYLDLAANQLAASGGATSYVHGGGTVYLSVDSECAWHISAWANEYPTVTSAPPTLSKTLLDLSGNGASNTATFTAPDLPGEWAITYSFDCTSYGYQGNFALTVQTAGGDYIDLVANDLAMSGNATTYVHGGGAVYLEINSECDWHVTAAA